MTNMAEAWAQYRESTNPDASEGQVRVMREAFYAGAISLANMIVTHMSDGPEVSPQDDAFIYNVMKELSNWSTSAR